MNLSSKEQIERMFEQIGSVSVPECEKHRYALRRMLLNSSYFNEHRNGVRRRVTLFVPAVASMFVVAILFVASQTHSDIPSESFIEQPFVVTNTFEPGFLTEGLSATFVDDRPMIPVTYKSNTVSFSAATMAVRVD